MKYLEVPTNSSILIEARICLKIYLGSQVGPALIGCRKCLGKQKRCDIDDIGHRVQIGLQKCESSTVYPVRLETCMEKFTFYTR